MALSETAARRLEALEGTAAHRAVVAALRAAIEHGAPTDCYKMNAARVAREVGVPLGDAVRAFLLATQVGVVDLSYDVHCPHCGGIAADHQHLAAVHEHGNCGMCKVGFDVDFAEQIEVTFTVNPGVRALGIEALTPEVMRALMLRDGRTRGDLSSHWVSAAFVTSQQDFRDLFAGEFLSPNASFAVRSLTFVFTDITGSTQMYEALGDARAYAIVQEHFRLMTEIIREEQGGIVKTIGDAVMAVFPVNVDAVRAALRIQRAFAASGDPLNDVRVKIGIHRGPAIAVTSNRAVDYFGRTVNVAARAEGKARPREVLVSEAVLDDPAVTALLSAEEVATSRFSVELKGVAQPLTVASLTPTSRKA
jgi:class 3 adenylate cyclase